MATVAAITALLALPWLWPFTTGPTPNVVPLLVSWGCGCTVVVILACSAQPGALLRRVLPGAWLLAALASAVIGSLQWFGEVPATSLISMAQVGEAYGNLRQKNQFATLMAIGLAVVLFRQQAALQWSSILAVLLLSAANALSASRTGLLEWLLLSLLSALWPGARRQRLMLCATGLAGYAVASAVCPHLLTAWRGVDAANVFLRLSTDLGCSSRTVLWSNVLHLIGQKPWTGWGPGELDYAHFVTIYPGMRFCDILDNAHNLPLQVAVEWGIPAALTLVIAAAWLVHRERVWEETNPKRQLAWGVLFVIGLHSLLEYPLWYGPFQWAWILAMAMLLPVERPSRAGRATVGVAGLLGLVVLVPIAVTYDRVSDAYRAPAQRRHPSLAMDPVGALGRPLLFADQVRFAELSLVQAEPANAIRVHALAAEMLHYSPEPAVIEKLADSALLLDRPAEVEWIATRYKAAFPEAYARWALSRGAHMTH